MPYFTVLGFVENFVEILQCLCDKEVNSYSILS